MSEPFSVGSGMASGKHGTPPSLLSKRLRVFGPPTKGLQTRVCFTQRSWGVGRVAWARAETHALPGVVLLVWVTVPCCREVR